MAYPVYRLQFAKVRLAVRTYTGLTKETVKVLSDPIAELKYIEEDLISPSSVLPSYFQSPHGYKNLMLYIVPSQIFI